MVIGQEVRNGRGEFGVWLQVLLEDDSKGVFSEQWCRKWDRMSEIAEVRSEQTSEG
jgi:hypothetical protein